MGMGMLRRLLSGLMAVAAVGVTSPAHAVEQTILPGYWTSTNTATLLVTKVTHDKRCITASEVNAYMTAPSTHHWHCTYGERSVGDGKLHMSGKCVDKGGLLADVVLDGVYTPDWFKLKAHFSLDGLPVGGSATTEAHRISDVCPADAPGAPTSNSK